MLYQLLIILFITSSQFIHSNMIKDMALMMGAQIGASVANQDITEEFQDTTKAVEADQKILNNATDSFLTAIYNSKANQLNTISSLFSTAGKQVNNIATKQQEMSQEVQTYIQSVVSLDKPQENYLDQPIKYDQLFTNGTMYTPKGQIWKNVFQIGDWEFDETTNSFWQYQAMPFLDKQSNDAFKNFIFTEWQPSKSYEIFCNITLYKVSYPFFVGIIFNKNRWISGDTYGLQKYRTLGIYGNAQKKISLCFAQEILEDSNSSTKSTQVNNSSAIARTPLEQIYNNEGIQNFTINQKTFTTLETIPLTFHLKIKPGIDAIMYKIWGNEAKEPSTYTTITVQNSASSKKVKNSSQYLASSFNELYLYHGIGFLSPGAIAQFTLKSPQDIIFSEKSISEFSQEISNNFNNQKYTLASKSLLKSTAGG